MRRCLKGTAIALAAFALCNLFVACNRDGGGEVINEGKMQLLVGNFKGGYGRTWLDKAKERFEKKYENVDFGNGKVGVQVIIHDDTRYASTIETRLSGYPQHVILGEAFNYYNLVDIKEKSSRHLADMTDVVTTPINYDLITGETDTSFGTGNETIREIMNSGMEEYLNVDGTGSYYAIPFYEATVGIVYDVDVFEKYGFYYAAEGYGDGGYVQDKDGKWRGVGGKVLGDASSMSFEAAKAAGMKLSSGPDGISGSYDDGMPATYDEFFALCLRMSERNVIPLTWPGSPEIQRYLNYLAYNLWTDYEGKDGMNLNFTLNGKAKDLIDLSSYNPSTGTYKTYEVDITDETGYLLQSQAGKYEAINFLYRLLKNTAHYDSSTCLSDISQAEAERRFLLAALPSQQDRAMLIDGSWWQNEARNIFRDMVVDFGDEKYSAQNRRLGWLTLPKANQDKVGEPSTVAFNTCSLIFINKNTTSDPTTLKIAKQFVKFLETRESLSEFNIVTSSARPYAYTLEESEIAQLTHVGKENYERHLAVDTVFTYSQNPIVRKYPEFFSCSGYTVFQSGGGLYEIVSQAFINVPSMTSWDYFKSMVEDHGQTFWKERFGNELGA